jgi:hypothetical protein
VIEEGRLDQGREAGWALLLVRAALVVDRAADIERVHDNLGRPASVSPSSSASVVSLQLPEAVQVERSANEIEIRTFDWFEQLSLARLGEAELGMAARIAEESRCAYAKTESQPCHNGTACRVL